MSNCMPPLRRSIPTVSRPEPSDDSQRGKRCSRVAELGWSDRNCRCPGGVEARVGCCTRGWQISGSCQNREDASSGRIGLQAKRRLERHPNSRSLERSASLITTPELSLTPTERTSLITTHATSPPRRGGPLFGHPPRYFPSEVAHKPPIDLTRPQRAAVDERGVSLHEGSASGQALPHIGGSLHPAHRDHAQRGGRVLPDDPEHRECPRRERCP